MSTRAVEQIIARISTDEAFRRQMQRDFEGALRGYDLTPQEKVALGSADDPGRAMGLDKRTTKTVRRFGR